MQKTYGERYRGYDIEVDVVRLDEGFFVADRLRVAKIREVSTRSVAVDLHGGLYFASIVEAVEATTALAKRKVDWLMQECSTPAPNETRLLCALT
jgi:hypothetical protein